MPEFKGTPGPWHIEQFDGEDTIYVSPQIDPDNMGICYLLPVDLTPSTGNPWAHGSISKANGQLIVAAPDLLSIVMRLTALEGEWHPDRYRDEKALLLKDAEAALAKALGQ